MAEPLSQTTYYLSSREQGSMPTQFSIAFAASLNSIRVYTDTTVYWLQLFGREHLEKKTYVKKLQNVDFKN